MEALSSSLLSITIFSPKISDSLRISRFHCFSRSKKMNSDSNASVSLPLSFISVRDSDIALSLASSELENENDGNSELPSNSNESRIVPLFPKPTLSQDEAMGLVLSAAGSVRGWTSGSGMEGPSERTGSGGDLSGAATFPWSLFTKSPRRRMRVAFTCNVCGQRTTRAINPHAYTDGTVFVQCCGCNVFHKLVDNLKLFHEMKSYESPIINYQGPDWDVSGLKYLEIDDDDDDSNNDG